MKAWGLIIGFVFTLIACEKPKDVYESAKPIYEEYAYSEENPVSFEQFWEKYQKYYRHIGADIYEVKTAGAMFPEKEDEYDIDNRIRNGWHRSSKGRRINTLVRRNIFHSTNWKIELEVMINNIEVTEPELPDNGHPVYFTFSDDENAGFIAIWPRLIEYYDLGPRVMKRGGWEISDISNKKVRLVLEKNDSKLDINITGKKFTANMDGKCIQLHNHEVSALSRYVKLEGPATRNFVRFGTVNYPHLTISPELKVYSLNISQSLTSKKHRSEYSPSGD